MTTPENAHEPEQIPSFPPSAGQAPPPPATPTSGVSTVPPRPVVTAFWLYIAAAALSVISLIVALTTNGNVKASLQHQLAANGQQMSNSTIDALIGVGIAVSIVFAVIWIVLFVLFAFFMKRGANWARIVLTVITALSFANLGSGYGAGLVQVIVAIIATILIWLRPAGEYFRAIKARKVSGYRP